MSEPLNIREAETLARRIVVLHEFPEHESDCYECALARDFLSLAALYREAQAETARQIEAKVGILGQLGNALARIKELEALYREAKVLADFWEAHAENQWRHRREELVLYREEKAKNEANPHHRECLKILREARTLYREAVEALDSMTNCPVGGSGQRLPLPQTVVSARAVLAKARTALETDAEKAARAKACRETPGRCTCGMHITELGDWFDDREEDRKHTDPASYSSMVYWREKCYEARAAVQSEREACALLAEEYGDRAIAKRIRERAE